MNWTFALEFTRRLSKVLLIIWMTVFAISSTIGVNVSLTSMNLGLAETFDYMIITAVNFALFLTGLVVYRRINRNARCMSAPLTKGREN